MEPTVDTWTDTTTSAISQVCDTQLVAAFLLEIGAALAAIQPTLGEEFVWVVERCGITVGGQKIHDDELQVL